MKRANAIAVIIISACSVAYLCGACVCKDDSVARERAKVKKSKKLQSEPVETVKKPPMEVIKTASAPKIDGDLNDLTWQKIKMSEPFGYSDKNRKGTPPYKTQVALAWDDKNIYVAFLCDDKDVWGEYRERDEPIFDEEVVEAYFAPSGVSGYYEFQVSPLGTIFDAYFSSYRQPDWKVASKEYNAKLERGVKVNGTVNERNDEDTGYSVEILIPFSELYKEAGHIPKIGEKWGANFYRFERPARGKTMFAAAMYPLSRPDFHYMADWGEIVFTDFVK